MNVLYGHSEIIADWVAVRIKGCERGFDKNKAIGVMSDGDIIAGVVYHNWCPTSRTIEVSSAADSPKWATREILSELFEYPFSFCRIVIARQSEFNTRSRRLWRAFGSTEHIIPDLRADGEAEVISTLTKSQWQNSRLYNGKKG